MYCAPNNSPTPKLGEGSGEIPGRVSAVQEHGDVEGLGEAELQLEVLLLRLDLAELRNECIEDILSTKQITTKFTLKVKITRMS